MSRFLLTGTKLKILLHFALWSVLFIIPTFLLYGDSSRDQAFLREVWFQLASYAVIFYVSYFLLAPRYFFSGKKLAYFISAAALILVFTLFLLLLNDHHGPVFHPGSREHMPQPNHLRETNQPEFRPQPPADKPPAPVRNWPLFNFFLTAAMVTGLSLGLRFSEKLILNEKRRKEAEREKLHTELELLKHQINPHFLFNTLNSIYSLALTKSEMTAEAVMKLSDMMRYVLQDVAQETVPLELELDYIVDYIELQQLRMNNNVVVHTNVTGDPKSWEIPPMILVPFIENAFKYGISSHENTVIGIDLKIEHETLSFTVSNQIFPGREKTETFGIGIQNTRQRLNLIYPDRHKLILTNNGALFIVNLEISRS
ncbi:MAG: sensor histidine kinase [Bacteroidetes bacterium]|nr:sensor histidine kinase [Bacteroidota bacterium]